MSTVTKDAAGFRSQLTAGSTAAIGALLLSGCSLFGPANTPEGAAIAAHMNFVNGNCEAFRDAVSAQEVKNAGPKIVAICQMRKDSLKEEIGPNYDSPKAEVKKIDDSHANVTLTFEGSKYRGNFGMVLEDGKWKVSFFR